LHKLEIEDLNELMARIGMEGETTIEKIIENITKNFENEINDNLDKINE